MTFFSIFISAFVNCSKILLTVHPVALCDISDVHRLIFLHIFNATKRQPHIDDINSSYVFFPGTDSGQKTHVQLFIE